MRDAFFAARTFTDLDDLNAQAEAWCRGLAADRRCPEDHTRSVREVFAEEAPRLLPLPDNPAPLLERVAVTVGKTPYVRFDLNDYSVPHTHVRRTADGARRSARGAHRRRRARCSPAIARSYDKGAQIEDAAHVQALVEQKRAARQHRATDRLAQAAPASQTLLMRAAERGANLGTITAALLRLLDRYGAAELQAAILEALERDVPHPNAVRLALERRREQRGEAPPVAIDAARACAGARRAGATARARNLRPAQGASPMTEPRHPARPRRGAASARPAGALVRGRRRRLARRRCSTGRSRSAPAAAWSAGCSAAHIGRFKPLCDFDWTWPKRCDRAAVEALMTLDFLNDATNVVLVGPNGVGKSTLAQNIAHQALIDGHTVLFTSAGQLLGDLCRARQRFRPAPPPAPLRPPTAAGHRRGRLSLLLQPPRRSDVRADLAPLPEQKHAGHHQPPVRRMARGLPQRRLRRLAGRPPGAQRRDRRHRGRILSRSRRPANAPSSAPASAAAPSHEQVAAAPPSCRHLRPITVEIPASWTPEQALAVFELLDDLRDKIWDPLQRPTARSARRSNAIRRRR